MRIPKGSTPPHAADARDAARGISYPAAQMQASRMGTLCGPPVGECIPFWDDHRPPGRPCNASSPPTHRMTLMISVMQMQVQVQMQIPSDHAGTPAAHEVR